MSHVKSSVIRKMEEYVKKLMFVDSLVIFDRVTELSGPLVEQRRSRTNYYFSKILKSIVNMPQYFSIVEFDVRKYTSTVVRYLEWFRQSLETSVAFSSLLAGLLTTIAMLVVVVLRSAS
ncbi:MAG: hypothetical protein RMI56_03860 [Sulfolobales archaeon]|nr:hypothetical protein [Sulfolobales archaeon]MDW8082918.1 hypothetical protein [Sulfolobales archaeon]